MLGFELATIFVAPSDFQNFWETDSRKLVSVLGALIEVATGNCKNAMNRTGGHFLSSLFPLLWVLFGGTKPSLHHPSLARCLGATRPRGLSGPLLGSLAASFGDLRRLPLPSSLFSLPSLRSSLCSLLSPFFLFLLSLSALFSLPS